MAFINRCYAINRSSNSIYYSDDFGVTWTEVPSNLSTASASDIGVSPAVFNDILVLNGAGAPSTPYLSTDGGTTFAAGANITGKEILYLSSTAIVTGGKRLKSNTGSEISISLDGGQTFSTPIDTTSLFSYPGAISNNITVMSIDFTSSAGGYIAIAGDQDNSLADQILARTVDRGNSFPDAIILSGPLYGVIRAVTGDPQKKVVFAAGEPGLPGRGKLYTINPALTDIPVEVVVGLTVGDSTNNRISKFFRRPGDITDTVFFIDSAGTLLKSEDGGTTWVNRSVVPGNCVDIMAVNDSTLIALTSSPNAILTSINDGISWQEVAQPTWNNPEAVAYNELPECLTCPPGYSIIGNINSERCQNFQITGPICKPPYQYFALDEVCASAATIQPANIVYAIDYSDSISPTEEALFIDFLLQVNALISDRLAVGSVQVGIVKWATNSCVTLPFTSDIDAINSNILNTTVSCNLDINTNHIGAFCESVNFLYTQSQVRPDAENVLIIFTDGAGNRNDNGCDLTSIGLTPVVSPGGTSYQSTSWEQFLSLADNTKQTLNGVGLKIMAVMVGTANDRERIEEQFISGPLSLGLVPYPSQTPGGNYYLFDGRDFGDVNTIVQQIRLGLASDQYPTEPCPEGCSGVNGIDDLGYCRCVDEVIPSKCLYMLSDCDAIIPPFYSDNQTFRFWFLPGSTRGFIITLQNEPDVTYVPGCFTLSEVTTEDALLVPPSEILDIRPDVDYIDCPTCANPTYLEFKDCTDPNNLQFSTEVVNWQQNYLPFNINVIKSNRPDLSPDTCWSVRIIDGTELPPNANIDDMIGWIGGTYESCPECLPADVPVFRFTDCQTNLPDVFTDRDFAFAVGQVIKLLQYPDVCWQVSLNLDPNVTVEVLAPDGLPFPLCEDCLPVAAVTYTLRDCNNQFNTIATESNMNQYLGGVVRLTTTGDTCWEVLPGSSPALIPQDVSVSQSFADCESCNPQIFRFIDCQNPNNIVNTLVDFSAYVGQTVNLQEYPGVCWVVSITDDINAPRQDVTIQGDGFADCETCLVTYYQLTNCANPDVFLISTSTELSRYLGRTITAAGYPGLCFTVTPPQCNCIRATINGVEYDAYVDTLQFNGRNVYYITTDSGDELAIAWSINPNRWELFDRNTAAVYGFTTADTDCPFSNFWTIIQASPYIITTVTFCADRIYNIAPELDFDDCIPCINCI
jgi:hypothetical protein